MKAEGESGKGQMRTLIGVVLLGTACSTHTCPATPIHCLDGYRFSSDSCTCEIVHCTTDGDCTGLGAVACDKTAGVCAPVDAGAD